MKIAGLSFLFACLLVAITACSSPPPRGEIVHVPKPDSDDLLVSLDDCKHAKENIAALEAEKSSTADQVKRGVNMVRPLRAVGKMLYGQYSHEGRVTVGKYDADIDRKINEIRNKCKVN